MKLNWGQGLFIAMTVFILFIVFLAVKLMRTDSSVEHEDYYQRGLTYENTLATERRTAPYADSVSATYANEKLTVTLPHSLPLPISKFRVHMYRSSDSDLDKVFNLDGDIQQYDFAVNVGELKHGSWQARLHWTGADDSTYYVEKQLFVQ